MTAAWLAVAAAAVAAYEGGCRALGHRGQRWPRWRRACWWAAAVLLAGAGMPPLVEAARRSIVLQSLQFGILAFGVGSLAVLGAPTRPLTALVGRPQPAARSVSRRAAACALAGFGLVTIGWRLPPAVDAVVGGRGWLALQAATLAAGTWWLWTAVIGTPTRRAVEPRPLRVVLAGVSAWSIWVFAYVVGFAAHAFYPAFATGSTAVGPQQVAVIVLWATSAAALVPVAFTNLALWLGREQQIAEAEMDDYRRRRRHAPTPATTATRPSAPGAALTAADAMTTASPAARQGV